MDLLVECLVKALEPCGVVGDRTNICLEDDVRRWGGTDHLAAPAEVSRAPGGPAGITAIMPPEKGLEATLGGFEIRQRIFTSPA
jgi:hypothetical protein